MSNQDRWRADAARQARLNQPVYVPPRAPTPQRETMQAEHNRQREKQNANKSN